MIEVGIATARRAALACQTVTYIMQSQTLAAPITVSVSSASDFSWDSPLARPKVLHGPRGLPAQRNTILHATSADVVIFLDDDFLPAGDFIEEAVRLFSENPDIVVATGRLLADGARTGGLEFEDGLQIVANAGRNNGELPIEAYGAYGCNMIVRMAPVRKHGLRFDENLPLYAWQEDIDFSRQLARYGRVVRAPRLRGVHLGTKRSGRSPGKQLGYSQIANPYYLIRKGTMSKRFAWRLVRNNVGGNILRFVRPEPTVDRRGRLLGNAIAVWDIIVGRSDPKRILEL